MKGLSRLTLDGYKLNLNIFAEKVKKKTEEITAADIRAYLDGFKENKMSPIGNKLPQLKSFFGWLAGEEIIQRDPKKKLKPPKVEKRLNH